MRKAIALALFSFFLPICAFGQKGMRQLAPEQKQELISYLKTHWQLPEDYVIGKFSQYDIVFIGEYHRIRHDVELIQNLIPRLYRAGVYNLGIEFGAYEYQEQVDRLLTADTYDENLARWIMFKSMSFWGYKEYMDIYRAAWKLNHSLAKEARKFRVVNLMYRPDWAVLTGERTPEVMGKVWHKGNPDEYMARIILTEFVGKGQKALIYSGSHHAFTHYYQPIYDFEAKKLYRFEKTRMGNVVYSNIPDKVFNIFLHSPWVSKNGWSDFGYPVGGAIDQVMREFKNRKVGFDVKGSPFGELRDPDTYYAFGYDNFTLSTFTDGYIFQKRLSRYEGCTVDPAFVTKDNLQEALAQLSNPQARKTVAKPEDAIRLMREDADIRRRFRGFE